MLGHARHRLDKGAATKLEEVTLCFENVTFCTVLQLALFSAFKKLSMLVGDVDAGSYGQRC